MRPKVADLIELLEELAPSRCAQEWDNPGLQAGHPSAEAGKILLTLDPTLQTVREAARRKAQVLLSHHPLLFRPLSCLNQGTYPGDVLSEALASGVCLIAAHTNLDAAEGGLNDILAGLLQLTDVRSLQEAPEPECGGAALGRIGFLPYPITASAMAQSVKKALSAERVRGVWSEDTLVRRIAVVAGSGGSMVRVAARMGAELLVTGDVTYHQALEAMQVGMPLIDAGHFQTERAALKPFADRLRSEMANRRWDVLLEVFEDERDPFRYE
ncbi:MAG: Nif3-like dinuclear metal center hexameric protein [Thermodesulfobacteriota bacterium]